MLLSWLLLAIGLSIAAPSAKPYAVNGGEGSIDGNTPSAAAQKLLDEHFPSDDGLSALLVFHGERAITPDERAEISAISEWLSSDERPEGLASAMPFHRFPPEVQDQLFSEDGTTVLLSAAVNKDLESDQIYTVLWSIREYVEQSEASSLQFEITGPAGIAADTITLFKNADVVLMLATVGLILLILILIYRSPLLAIIPLAVAGIVYQIVDRLLGLAAKYGWFAVDKQALSIMMILLFAVLTDYCLFVLSRYREQLRMIGSKYDAMKISFTQVMEPIMFSGTTVLAAVLVLFAAVFKPYYSFAPVFTVAVIVMLLGGLTLIPAIFTLAGRRAFWPYVPKLEVGETRRTGLWKRVGAFVTERPAAVAGSLLVLLVLASVNMGSIRYSFNLMQSFPNDISSRLGFEILGDRYPQGQLAPVTVLLASDQQIDLDAPLVRQLSTLLDKLRAQQGISSVTPEVTLDLAEEGATLPRNFLSEQREVIRLQLTLQDNPYDQEALDLVNELRSNSKLLLKESGFDPSHYQLHYSGQTAEQLDVRKMNQTDMVVIFSLIAIVLAIMLALQSGSIKIAMLMMGTLLLSYTATIGFGWFLFHGVMGYESISYRLPVYAFVFLIALGVDYNIMLVSRIKEEARHYEWKEAINRAVALTGGVITSAGIILAATFSVLITQPLQELFLFGLTMAIGILADTFLIRGMLFPSLMVYLGKGGDS